MLFLGRNINVLVPHPWKELHNRFVSTYNQTGVCKVMGSTRSLMGLHKQGHAFAMKLELRESHTEDRRRILVGMITEEATSDGEVIVLANATGEIQFASESVLRVFGYTAVEIVRENVSILMPETQSFSHAGHMSRYMETGEGKIGT
jgi:PAS domain-containing protein